MATLDRLRDIVKNTPFAVPSVAPDAATAVQRPPRVERRRAVDVPRDERGLERRLTTRAPLSSSAARSSNAPTAR